MTAEALHDPEVQACIKALRNSLGDPEHRGLGVDGAGVSIDFGDTMGQ